MPQDALSRGGPASLFLTSFNRQIFQLALGRE